MEEEDKPGAREAPVREGRRRRRGRRGGGERKLRRAYLIENREKMRKREREKKIEKEI